jgi:hypothetical protein
MQQRIFLLLSCLFSTVNTFSFLTRRWDFDAPRDMIDSLATDHGNLFLVRNNKMQWFRPLTDKPTRHLEREFPRIIHHLSVKKKSLLVNMSPETPHHMSETMVFVKDKCYRVLWKDNTLFETVIEKNGYLLRSNYHGDITYGDERKLFTYNTRTYTNTTYSTMCVHNKYLWCAMEYEKNNTRMTRIDAFDLHVCLNDTDYIASVPEMSFHLENKGCVQPCQLVVSIKHEFPVKIVYLVVGYMRGGVNVAQTHYPPEKQQTHIISSLLPCEKMVRSVSLDMPYLFFLDEEGISSYKIFPRVDVHQYMGFYKLPPRYYSECNQIVSIKKQVFWNGEQVLHSAEIIED